MISIWSKLIKTNALCSSKKNVFFFLVFFQPFDQVIAIVLFWCLSSIYQDMAFFLIFERTNNSVRTSENGQGGTKTYVIKIKLEYVQMARTICTGHCLKCGSTFNVSLPNSLSTALRRTMLQQRGLTTHPILAKKKLGDIPNCQTTPVPLHGHPHSQLASCHPWCMFLPYRLYQPFSSKPQHRWQGLLFAVGGGVLPTEWSQTTTGKHPGSIEGSLLTPVSSSLPKSLT